ncbi:hypothetical protein T229_02300, partial [Tannerella sp. oral taxon BU063 isolate Cell 5]
PAHIPASQSQMLPPQRREDVLCFEDDENIIITNGETLYDTSESLSVEENGGQPTIEVFANNGEDIINNKPDNTEQI